MAAATVYTTAVLGTWFWVLGAVQGRDGRWYVVDTARVFPPEAPQRTLPALILPENAGGVSHCSCPLAAPS